jgi:hypothetical protein
VSDSATYGAHGPETDEDVDVVGDADVGTCFLLLPLSVFISLSSFLRLSSRARANPLSRSYRARKEKKDRLRGNTRRCESRREQVP